jgi:hypothetical protein
LTSTNIFLSSKIVNNREERNRRVREAAKEELRGDLELKDRQLREAEARENQLRMLLQQHNISIEQEPHGS